MCLIDHMHQIATVHSGETIMPSLKQQSSLPTREELRSRYAEIMCLPNTESKAKLVNAIGAFYHQHYRDSGRKSDLDEAIRILEQVVKISCFYSELGEYSYRLADALKDRFNQSGTYTDKKRAIKHCQDAILLSSGESSKNPETLSLLGQCFELRYKLLRAEEDQGRAITLYTKAVEVTPQESPGRLWELNRLGITLMKRFTRFGKLEDAESAISAFQNAAQLTPDGHPDKASRLSNFGSALRTRFERVGRLEDIEMAISILQDAAELTPNGHPDKPSLLNNLGSALYRRFERISKVEDIEAAISTLQNAAELTPNGHPDKPSLLNNLGSALSRRFERSDRPEDIETGISVLQNATELMPDGHPDKPSLLNSLGSALSRRFERAGKLEDMKKAISVLQNAAKLTPDGHPDKSSRLSNLGNTHLVHFRHTLDENHVKHAHSFFFEAANSPVGSPHHLFKAARKWAECEMLLSRSPLPAFARALELLPRIAWLGLSVTDQHSLLTEVGDVVHDAVTAAIQRDEYELAVQWTEQGRSIVWQNVLNLRTPVDQLVESHPDLADRLRIISRQLEISTTYDTGFNQRDKPGLEEVARKHRKLSLERDKLIDTIRAIPGFKSFMNPKRFHELASVAHEGPVVILNVHKLRCDALVLIPGDADVSAVVIPLEELSYEMSGKMLEKLENLLSSAGVRSRGSRAHVWVVAYSNDAIFKNILGILWKQVVKPVIDGLAYKVRFVH
jgi:tetratricopeptide (TPR) repeat protein